MSLIEVMVALLLLTGVILALGKFTAQFAMAAGQTRLIIAANEIAAARLDAIRTQPTYAAVGALAESTTVTRDYTTFTRITRVRQVGGQPTDSVDYRLVTVRVTHPAMRKQVYKTTAVAAF
jgi:Tfp pilus assembly protein PilV